MQNMFHNVREFLTPLLKDSKFKETGVLTPEEFIAAGDFLVYKCPTWSWEAGDPSKSRQYLPANKQYLVTKNVPCMQRVKQMQDSVDTREDGNEGDWVETVLTDKAGTEEITEIDVQGDAQPAAKASSSASDIKKEAADDDEIPDMDDFNEDNLVEDDPANATNASSSATEMEVDNIVKTRTYDISITYDKYYQTPRIWLFGYDEQRRPLTPEQIFEDISQDHAKKTVTIDPHPHLPQSMASIHPCKHSNVMKKIIDHLVANGKELRVDQYLMIFLKFMASVLPTIDYDHTVSMDG